MPLSIIEGVGARRAEPSAAATDGAVTWWDVAPGDEPPPFADAELIAELSRPTLVPSCRMTPHGLAIVVHSLDDAGHLVQLGILAGDQTVVTVHAAFNDAVAREAMTAETAAVEASLLDGEARVATGSELGALILAQLSRTLRGLLEDAAARAGQLDRRIRDERIRDQEAFLHDLFEVRRDLFTVRNRLAQTTEIAQAAARHDPTSFADVVDVLEHLLRMCDGERDFFSGVIEYFEQRVNVKINFASERLALIAALVLPLSAVSGIIGMNTIVQDRTNVPLTIVLVSVMAVMVVALLVWAKRKEWW